MYCFSDFCCICFSNKNLQPIFNSSNDDITCIAKLSSTLPDICFQEMNNQRLVCKECRDIIDSIYKFRQTCLRSKVVFADYISQLRAVSQVEGCLSVRLTDLKHNIKSEEPDTEIKCEINKMDQIEYFNSNLINNIKIENNGTDYEDNCKTNDRVMDMEITESGKQDDIENVTSNSDCFVNQGALSKMSSVSGNNFDIIKEEICIKMENENDNFENDQEMPDFTNSDNETEFKVFTETLKPTINKPVCNICSVAFEHISQLEEHLLTHNSDKVIENNASDTTKNKTVCEICHKTFSKSYINVHMRIHRGEKRYECTFCGKKFIGSGHLSRHIQVHTGDKPHECSICHKKYNSPGVLNIHIQTHKGVKPFECSICQKKFTVSSSLQFHMRTHTDEKTYECSSCDLKFMRPYELNRHMKVHTGDRSFECNICNKKFIQSGHLTLHMRSHTGEKPYECTVCEKKFVHKVQLTIHMRVHTGEKPYECTVCKKRFSNPRNHSVHMRSHTGEKPYECSLCNKKFTASASLKKHMRLHSGERSYKCYVCNIKFNESGLLITHMRSHTGDKPHECNV